MTVTPESLLHAISLFLREGLVPSVEGWLGVGLGGAWMAAALRDRSRAAVVAAAAGLGLAALAAHVAWCHHLFAADPQLAPAAVSHAVVVGVGAPLFAVLLLGALLLLFVRLSGLPVPR